LVASGAKPVGYDLAAKADCVRRLAAFKIIQGKLGVNSKLQGLQVARAVAAMTIVYFHSWVAIARFPKDTAYQIPGLTSYGHLAVDLFFAISGFVICLVVSRDTFDVRSFLIKRVFRLYPLWLVMLTIFAITAWRWRGLQPGEDLEFFLYSATLLPTHELPFYNVGWSLQHEMIFYLIALVLVPLFGLIGLVAFLTASTLAYHSLEMPWFLSSLASHHAMFLAGVLAFLMRAPMAKLRFFIPVIVGVTMFCTLIVAGLFEWLPVALFFVMVALANLHPSETTWWRKPIMALGDASYSLYLIHPLVFFTMSAIVSKIPFPLWSQEPIRFVCIAIIICASLISWRYFEKPMIHFGNNLAERKFLNYAKAATGAPSHEA
jgi:peptidoglycan/LPS O-acetylase OafA/YrhL